MTTCLTQSPSSGDYVPAPLPRPVAILVSVARALKKRKVLCDVLRRCSGHAVEGEAATTELHRLVTSVTQLFMDACGAGVAAADRSSLVAAAHEAWWPTVDHATWAARECTSPAFSVCKPAGCLALLTLAQNRLHACCCLPWKLVRVRAAAIRTCLQWPLTACIRL